MRLFRWTQIKRNNGFLFIGEIEVLTLLFLLYFFDIGEFSRRNLFLMKILRVNRLKSPFEYHYHRSVAEFRYSFVFFNELWLESSLCGSKWYHARLIQLAYAFSPTSIFSACFQTRENKFRHFNTFNAPSFVKAHSSYRIFSEWTQVKYKILGLNLEKH